ncbi:hypothetical protein [Bdellovibrio sp. NC01]|uniref:hypothetical protein n=1 Tax=Bdellovibrio sp. NC01 TaxID=2220073 RepID=UPI00115A9293|nr:hypothetical protein [Bdellovibrio sp. NC01]QDK38448.1 hypothetical protein DOE51_13115 [Bdellovibrio sp. NC01]
MKKLVLNVISYSLFAASAMIPSSTMFVAKSLEPSIFDINTAGGFQTEGACKARFLDKTPKILRDKCRMS